MADEPTAQPTDEPGDDEPGDQPSDTSDWKAMARKHEREAKKLRTELAAAQKANETAAEAAIREAREEAASAARGELEPALAAARLETAVLRSAGTKLADPADALRFIDASLVSDDDGQVDAKKLGKAIDDLIAEKPYLAAGHKATPAVPGGPRTPSDAPTDMNALIRRGRVSS